MAHLDSSKYRTKGPLLLYLSPFQYGKDQFINNLEEQLIELKFDNEDKLYHKKELNYVDESFKYEINDNITKYSKSFKLNFNIKREIQLIALLINQNITYEIFEENMKDLLKDCDILIFELMKAIKLIIDDPSINNELITKVIQIYRPEKFKSLMDQLFNKINYEIKKNRFVLLCNLNNHERAVHINKYIDTIKIVLKSAYKNKRVVRFIRWGQEIPNVPLRIIIKDNIINFLKYGKYISLSEIYDIYQKNLQFHQNFESKKHSDYARLFGYHMRSDGTIYPMKNKPNYVSYLFSWVHNIFPKRSTEAISKESSTVTNNYPWSSWTDNTHVSCLKSNIDIHFETSVKYILNNNNKNNKNNAPTQKLTNFHENFNENLSYTLNSSKEHILFTIAKSKLTMDVLSTIAKQSSGYKHPILITNQSNNPITSHDRSIAILVHRIKYKNYEKELYKRLLLQNNYDNITTPYVNQMIENSVIDDQSINNDLQDICKNLLLSNPSYDDYIQNNNNLMMIPYNMFTDLVSHNNNNGDIDEISDNLNKDDVMTKTLMIFNMDKNEIFDQEILKIELEKHNFEVICTDSNIICLTSIDLSSFISDTRENEQDTGTYFISKEFDCNVTNKTKLINDIEVSNLNQLSNLKLICMNDDSNISITSKDNDDTIVVSFEDTTIDSKDKDPNITTILQSIDQSLKNNNKEKDKSDSSSKSLSTIEVIELLNKQQLLITKLILEQQKIFTDAVLKSQEAIVQAILSKQQPVQILQQAIIPHQSSQTEQSRTTKESIHVSLEHKDIETNMNRIDSSDNITLNSSINNRDNVNQLNRNNKTNYSNNLDHDKNDDDNDSDDEFIDLVILLLL